MRRELLPVFMLVVCSLAPCRETLAQENKAESARSFNVTIVEARLSEQSVPSEATAEMLWAMLRNSTQADWIESIQCTILEGQRTNVKFGRTVSVVTGITESQFGQTRNLTEKSLGTGVSLTVELTGEEIGLMIDYQASRFSSDNNGELPPPEVESNQYTSIVKLKLGMPKLLSSTPKSRLMVLIDSDTN